MTKRSKTKPMPYKRLMALHMKPNPTVAEIRLMQNEAERQSYEHAKVDLPRLCDETDAMTLKIRKLLNKIQTNHSIMRMRCQYLNDKD